MKLITIKLPSGEEHLLQYIKPFIANITEYSDEVTDAQIARSVAMNSATSSVALEIRKACNKGLLEATISIPLLLAEDIKKTYLNLGYIVYYKSVTQEMVIKW